MVAFPLAFAMFPMDAGKAQMIALLTSWSVFAVHRILTYELPLMGRRFVAVRLAAAAPLPLLAAALFLLPSTDCVQQRCFSMQEFRKHALAGAISIVSAALTCGVGLASAADEKTKNCFELTRRFSERHAYNGVTYSIETGFRPLRLDIYRDTKATASKPVVLVVHGGAWVAFDVVVRRWHVSRAPPFGRGEHALYTENVGCQTRSVPF